MFRIFRVGGFALFVWIRVVGLLIKVVWVCLRLSFGFVWIRFVVVGICLNLFAFDCL